MISSTVKLILIPEVDYRPIPSLVMHMVLSTKINLPESPVKHPRHLTSALRHQTTYPHQPGRWKTS
ncbi:MAG: hypothetical protein GY696_21560 [Gammaproteobacteria bacterium]|nr:hypothetical protein [Gammaproteobacteria bacterium]